MEIEIKVKGAALISKNIIKKKAKLKFCVRREPTSEYDTGWVFISKIDDDEYCGNDDNFEIMTYVDIIEKIEPAVGFIYGLPIGSSIQLAAKWGKRFFADSITGKKLDL